MSHSVVKSVVKIAVTGAAGQIAYSLLFRIANGELFGPKQPISLHLLDLENFHKSLEGVAMELEDCAFPLLREIRIGHDLKEMFAGVNTAFLLGAKPRGPGMERKDLLQDNGSIFALQGRALDEVAAKDVRVLVVGNPCNTNCLIALTHAPSLSPKQFFAMTRLDQNRATFQLAARAKVRIEEVTNVAIWGNHSSTQAPDFVHAKVRGKKAADAIHDLSWLQEEFMSKVQKRGAAVIDARGKSSAASAAHAALGAMRALYEKTKENDFFSMGVYSKGNPYGIDGNLVFSFPCTSEGHGDAEIVPNLSLDSFLKEKLLLSQKELQEERELVASLLRK